jgi:hypothetical protein
MFALGDGGTLTLVLAIPDNGKKVRPFTVNAGSSSGTTLIGATTNLPGKLVISSAECSPLS